MLWKKMVREIFQNKGSYAATLVLVLLSLVIFTATAVLNENLALSQEQFYEEQNFADGFIEVMAMPRSSLPRVAAVEGIRQVGGRLVEDVRVYAPDREESVYLRLVSVDVDEPRRINDVLILEGNPLETPRDVWLESQFLNTNNISLGDSLDIIVGGRIHSIRVVGTGMSPEFTYPLRDQKELYPNYAQFGIAFMAYDDMEALLPHRQGQVNSVVLTLEDGADFDRIRREIEQILRPYGVVAVYPRADQMSHLILDLEITQLQNVGRSMPLMFMFIGGIILYIMLKRLVEQQRTQIGIMKAIGYTEREIMVHYLSYGLFVGTIGGVTGGLLGLWAANPLTTLLLTFFAMPMVYSGFSWVHLLIGLLLSLSIFTFAGYHGCKQALRMKPADAMRPPAPSFRRKVILERIRPFWGMLTTQGMMATRNMFRNISRTVFLFLGISLSCAVVAVTWSFNDMTDKMLFYQYDEVEVYDAKVTLASLMHRQPVARDLGRQEEVTGLEPHLEVPARLSNRWLEEDTLLLGIEPEGQFYRILDSRGRRVVPGPGELILSDRLAGLLQVGPGDVLQLESPLIRGREESRLVTVTHVVPQYLGTNAYMAMESLEDLLGQGPVATSFLLGIRGQGAEKDQEIINLRTRYLESDRISALDGTEERIRQTREMMDAFGSIIYIYVLFGVIMGFSIIYSSSFIILSERSRELASMMVLGMSPREAFSVIAFEQWFISLFGILAGLPIAVFLQAQFAAYMSTDLFVIPAELSPGALVAGPLITAFSIWVAQRFVLRQIGQMSLIEVLKSRE